MYASHRELLKRAEELRHKRNLISEQYSSAKVELAFTCYKIFLVKTYVPVF